MKINVRRGIYVEPPEEFSYLYAIMVLSSRP
jgi:hypothetical protein